MTINKAQDQTLVYSEVDLENNFIYHQENCICMQRFIYTFMHFNKNFKYDLLKVFSLKYSLV
jgi:hypothetical protein